MCKTVNLKGSKFIRQYVGLRNRYVKELLTEKVTVPNTLKWVEETNVELYGLIKGRILLGAIVVYLEKDGEVAFFVKEPGQGYGSKLLKIADGIAKRRQLSHLWAWTRTENLAAARAFEGNGYKKQGAKIRNYEGEKIKGYVFVKQFKEG